MYNRTMGGKKENSAKSTKAEKSEKSKSNKKSGIGLALWCLAALILIVLFLVERDKIVSNLKEADFFDSVFGKTPTFIEEHEGVPPSETDKNDVAPLKIIVDEKPKEEKKAAVAENVNAQNKAAEEKLKQNEEKKTAEKAEEEKAAADKAKAEKEKEDAKAKAEAKAKELEKKTEVAKMNLKLFFIEIGSDGSVNRKEFTRSMKKSDSPLVDAINALITGPTAEEGKSGCRSFIPEGTRLTGASVKDGVATLNFSEEFEFNQFGVEGTLAQLQQVVFTATAFPTVNSVQILIEGERLEYLGSEGVWIGRPLSRSNF